MYDWEIQQFLRDRNYYIGGDDLTFITDTRQHPQIDHIIFNPGDSSYDMWSKEGTHFHFNAMPYKEALERGLVKSKEEDLER